LPLAFARLAVARHKGEVVENTVVAEVRQHVAQEHALHLGTRQAANAFGARVGGFDRKVVYAAVRAEHGAQYEEGVQAALGGGGVGFLGAARAPAHPRQLPGPARDHGDHQQQQRAGAGGGEQEVAAFFLEGGELLVARQADHDRQREAVQALHAGVAHHAVRPLVQGDAARPRTEFDALAPAHVVAHAQRAHHAVEAGQSQHAVLAVARTFVGAGEVGGIGFDDRDARECASGIVDAAREMQVGFVLGAVADRRAHKRQVEVIVAVVQEIGRAGDIVAASVRIAGDDAPVAVGDRHHEYQAGRQQSLFAQGRNRAGRAIQFDRVLDDLEGLVDAVQAARHLRFIRLEALARGRMDGDERGRAVGVDHAQGQDPDPRDEEDRKQRQRNMRVEAAPEPAREQRTARLRARENGAGRHGASFQCNRRTGRTVGSSASRSM